MGCGNFCDAVVDEWKIRGGDGILGDAKGESEAHGKYI